ncbi:MAG: 30S ribosome-binding factor RbfA [Acidobacteria bacterium]|nr:MAG: 30S ribosome-binding factor RbfA [Acidobacteriota bacterium]
MTQSYRPIRVADEIREHISVMLAREVHDPGIGFVTITRVEVTPDLQLARVFYTVIGSDAQKRETERGLRRATPFLRYQVGQRLRLRRVPVLEFRFDKSIENQERVEQLLREIHEQEGQSDQPDHDPDGEPD